MTQKLVARLQEILTSPGNGRQLCILLGAGVTTHSVPEVPELTSRALQYLDENAGGDLVRSTGPVVLPTTVQSDRISRYSEALGLLRREHGAPRLRAFLQQAALEPYDGDLPSDFPQRALTQDEFRAVEADMTGWNTPFGLRSLASVIRTFDTRICRHLLTTNFDGLLQLALRGTTPNVETLVPGYDAAPQDELTPGTRAVVHLHGDCRSSTLHSPAEFRGSRPRLESWLRDHLRDKVLLVVGYSGWDDTIRHVLRVDSDDAISAERNPAAEVLWAVYEDEREHGHINSTLADFFRANPQRVDPYYGIDGDRLFQELEEAVRRDSTTRIRTTDSSFDEEVRKLKEYKFGHTPVNQAVRTRIVFWPHRLREPHLIHAVHALTAIRFGKIGLPVELHLDDIGIPEQRADFLAAEFVEAVRQWFAACGVPDMPTVRRFTKTLSSMDRTDSAARLWGIAKAFYSKENTAFDALAAAKVIETDEDLVAVPPSEAQRLLRPLYTWLALEVALERRGLMKPASGRAVTLGGRDEQKMWDLWRKRSEVPPVASVYVPYLEAPAEGTDLWRYEELRRDTAYGQHDLARFLRRMQTRSTAGSQLLEWVYIVAVKLASTVSVDEVAVTVNGRTIDSWEGMQAALRSDPAAATAAMARAVATWFQASPIGPA
ncbi:SIR2 family protein [Amycolatopsis sp. NPDC101161]|uniref:SIR2 family protein n=1 Tax=Amycolatopsis sp. NPDC101161 TaxID=3363940 RepID=UPI0038211464